MMIPGLLLLSLFCKSTQDGNGQEHEHGLLGNLQRTSEPDVVINSSRSECNSVTGVLHCGPQNLTLSSSGQMILLTWKDEPLCSAVQDVLIYELQVLIADKQVHYDEVAVTPDQTDSTHSWNWTSYLALKCAAHSVRLSYRYKNHTSPWKLRTLPGREVSRRPEIFPKDKWFKVGSRVTFCCVLPEGEVFNRMYLAGYSGANTNTTQISNQTYALTVDLNQGSYRTCTNVKCESLSKDNGACTTIGYAPDYRDLQCETQDLESVECHWTVGRHMHLSIMSQTVYQLLGRPCTKQSEGRCSQKFQVDVGERNWTVTAQNEFGKVELSDTADLTKRVHMFPPKEVTASTVNARDVSLKWRWTEPQYYNLNITCQVNVSQGGNTIMENFGVGLSFVILYDLIPNWKYNVTVRCGTAPHFWKWSDWSTSVNLHTKGDVPDALDVWMQRKDNQMITIWKMPLANQSHGDITEYEVTWTKTTERELQNRTKVSLNIHSLALSLDPTEEYIVTVTARNINGSSDPSTITIPSLKADRTKVNTSWIIGSNRRFNLSWSASPSASCGYIVDWCPTLGERIVEWLQVPPNETNAIIFSKDFTDGLRYSLSIYACTQGAPVLLERREGYVSEKSIEDGLFKSLKGRQQESDFEVSWEPVSLREQTSFIQGYVLYCSDNNNKVISFSTDDPEATSLTARNLQISSYTFTVKAQTAVGECGTTFITATLNSLTDDLIKVVVISLVTVFGFLSLITIVCYRHWACIKERVYPSIPKPVLILPAEHRCRPPYMDQCQSVEEDFLDVPELLCSSGAPMSGYISPEDRPFVFSQTPKGYYNQPLRKCTPQPLTLATAGIPSQSGLQSSPFRSVFPNLSYNVIMQPGDQQSHLGLEFQEGTSLERSSSGYQPQGHSDHQTEEDPESPMSCVSTYILLPPSR